MNASLFCNISTNGTSTNDLCTSLTTSALECIHANVPLQFPSKKPSLPPHILKLMKYREKLWTNIHHKTVEEKFVKAAKDLKIITVKFFRNKEKNLLSKKSSKQIHNYISSHLKPKRTNIPTLHYNGTTSITNIEKANAFAKHFSSVFLTAHPNFSEFESTPYIENGLSYIDVSSYEVVKILTKLPNKSNSSPDGIPYVFIKKCYLSLFEPITHLFRYSMMSGALPDI